MTLYCTIIEYVSYSNESTPKFPHPHAHIIVSAYRHTTARPRTYIAKQTHEHQISKIAGGKCRNSTNSVKT